MATISVPLPKEYEEQLDTLVKDGVGSNRADVMRKALARLAREEAVQRVLRAQEEPTLRGDLKALAKQLDV